MANEAMSFLGGIGIGQEASFGAAASISDWLQASSESMSFQQNEDVSAAIFTDSQVIDTVPGRIVVGGSVVVPAYGGSGFGRLLKFASRNTSSAQLGYRANLSSVTAAAGGSLASGTYDVQIIHVVSHDASGRLYMTSPSPVGTVTLLSGEGTIDASWSLPSSLEMPFGFSLAGTILARSEAGAHAVHVVSYHPGAGTSASDDGSQAPGVAVSSTVYVHQFGPNHAQPPSFSMECVDDNGFSRFFTGCMVNQLALSIKPGERVQATFDLFAQTMNSVASSTPAPTAINGFHGKDVFCYVADSSGNYTQNNLVNSFDLTIGNKLNRRDNINGDAFVRAIRAQLRDVRGSADFDFESLEQQTAMLDKEPRDFRLMIFGNGIAPQATFGAVKVYSWPYMMQIHIPNFVFESTTSNLSSDSPINDRLPFIARKSASAGYECRLELFNTASSL